MMQIVKKNVKKIKYVDFRNIIKIIFGLIFTGKIIVNGLNTGNVITNGIKQICAIKKIQNINQINMPLLIPAVNLINGEVIIFSSKEMRGYISDEIKYITNAPIDIAIRSSCSYPGIFSPCEYNGMQLIDGGVRENLAWKELKQIGANSVLGINFESSAKEQSYYNNIIEIAMRSMSLMEHELYNYEIDGIDNLVTITTKKIGLLDINSIDYLYDKGYNETKRRLQNI